MLEKEIMLLPPIQINWSHFELQGVLKNMSITIPKDEIGDFIQPRTKLHAVLLEVLPKRAKPSLAFFLDLGILQC
jgi:hypothetical protein